MRIESGTVEADAMETILEAAVSWANYAEEYALESGSEAFANQARHIDEALNLIAGLSSD